MAHLALACAERGNSNTVTDGGVAAMLADAGCRGAAFNVRINVVSLADRSKGAPLEAEALALVAETAAVAQTALERVEQALA